MKRIFGISGLTLLLASLLYFSFPGRQIDMKAYDIYSCIRGSEPPPAEIVIAGIDEASLSAINFPWPWPRSIHAKLITELHKAGARMVIMDILFSTPSVPKEDKALADAIRAYPSVVLAADIETAGSDRFAQSRLVTPIEEFTAAGAHFGISSIPLDADNVVRRIFWGTPEGDSLELSVLETLGIPRKKDTAKMIHFLSPSFSFPYVSYAQAVAPDRHLPEGFFRDKIVLVGKQSRGSKESFSEGSESSRSLPQLPAPLRGVDLFATPYSIIDPDLVSGVEIHANMLLSLLRDDSLKPLSSVEAVLLIVLLSIFLTVVNRNWSPWKSIGLNLLIGSAFLAGAYLLFSRAGRFLPFAAPLSALVVNFISSGVTSYVGVERKRRYLKEAFSHYLSPQVAKKILQDPEELKLGGQRVEATILFSDLAGFTGMSEKVDPEEVVRIMTRFMTEMTKIVFKYEGTLDKFIGDAIMAVWGTPAADREQALHACRAALEMQRKTEDLAEELAIEGYRLAMRIGINSGTVMAGNMGSEERFDFTVIGDNVNIASRLEGLNKPYGTKILIGEETRAQIADTLATRELDRVRAKGKKQAIRIYELVDGDRSPHHAAFEEGLRLYREGRFEPARQAFLRSLELSPQDGPGRLYIERCHSFLMNPPSPDWDGAWEF